MARRMKYEASTEESFSVRGIKEQIGASVLLSHEEFLVLFRDWRANGDQKVFDAIFSANLRIAYRVAQKMQKAYGVPLEDTYQVACMGLKEGIEKFDPEKGFKLITYAWRCAQGYIVNEFHTLSQETIRLPDHTQRGLRKLAKAHYMLTTKGRPPDARAVSDHLNWTEKQVQLYEKLRKQSTVSLEAPTLDEEENTLGETIPAPERANSQLSKHLAEKVAETAAGLSPRDRAILFGRILSDLFNERPVPLETIGKAYKITRERVRQLEKKLRIHLQFEWKHFFTD